MLCELCQSESAHNFHHFIPRTLHRNKWFKKRYARAQMQAGLKLCKSCHDPIHDLIPDEQELGRHYHTMEKLLAHPLVAGYVKWKRERLGSERPERGDQVLRHAEQRLGRFLLAEVGDTKVVVSAIPSSFILFSPGTCPAPPAR
jgi:hypothetical protein